MARLITRMADLCRQRAAEDRFLRRYGMRPDAPAGDDEAAGPGWYESSRELEVGLLVIEHDEAGDAPALPWSAFSGAAASPPRARATPSPGPAPARR